MKFVSLDVAKAHLQMDHDEDDEDIERKIEEASGVISDYLAQGDELYADSNGDVPAGADGEPDVPHSVRAATLLMVQMLYKGEITQSELDMNYLPRPVMNLLYPRRTPVMA